MDIRRDDEIRDFGRPSLKPSWRYVSVTSHGSNPPRSPAEFATIAREKIRAANNDSDSVRVLVSCMAGVRSKQAARWLADTNCNLKITELDDGFVGWVKAGLPIQKGG